VWEAATICPACCKLTFDLLILKVVSESCVTWATSVPILVFPGLFVFDLGPMYATDRQTDKRQTSDTHHRLMRPPYETAASVASMDATALNGAFASCTTKFHVIHG